MSWRWLGGLFEVGAYVTSWGRGDERLCTNNLARDRLARVGAARACLAERLAGEPAFGGTTWPTCCLLSGIPDSLSCFRNRGPRTSVSVAPAGGSGACLHRRPGARFALPWALFHRLLRGLSVVYPRPKCHGPGWAARSWADLTVGHGWRSMAFGLPQVGRWRTR